MSNREKLKTEFKFFYFLLIIVFVVFGKIIFLNYSLEGGPEFSPQYFPLKKYSLDILKEGHLPFWNNLIFLGHPLYADPGTGIFFPTKILFVIFPTAKAINLSIIVNFFLAAFFTYLFLNYLGVGITLSLLGSVIFITGNLFFHFVGSTTILEAISLTPLEFLLATLLIKKSKFIYAVALGLIIGIQILSGEVEICFYVVCFLLIYYLTLNNFKNNRKNIFIFLIPILFALAISLVQLLPLLELTANSFRINTTTATETFLSQPKLTPLHIPFFFLIYLFSDKIKILLDFPSYTDLIIFMLIPLATFFFSKKFIKVFFTLTLLAFIIPFMEPIFNFIPFLNILRGRYKIFPSVFQLSAITLSMLVLKQLLFSNNIEFKKFSKVLKITVRVLLGLLFVSCSFFFLISAKDKSSLNLQTFIFKNCFLFIAVVIFNYYLIVKLIKNNSFFALFSFFIFAEIIFLILLNPLNKASVISNPLSTTLHLTKNKSYPATLKIPSLKNISRIDDGFNPLSAEGYLQNFSIIYNIKNFGGYSALRLNRFNYFFENLSLHPKLNKSNLNSFLGINYQVNYVDSDKSTVVLKKLNKKPYPQTFVVYNYKVLPAEDILKEMAKKDFIPEKAVLLEEKPQDINIKPTAVKLSKVNIIKTNPNNLLIKTNTKDNGFLVIISTYYPGWKAYVNGRQTKIFRAYYLFQAIYLPAGKYKILLKYEPTFFPYIYYISLSFLFLILLYFAFLFLKTFYEKNKK